MYGEELATYPLPEFPTYKVWYYTVDGIRLKLTRGPEGGVLCVVPADEAKNLDYSHAQYAFRGLMWPYSWWHTKAQVERHTFELVLKETRARE